MKKIFIVSLFVLITALSVAQSSAPLPVEGHRKSTQAIYTRQQDKIIHPFVSYPSTDQVGQELNSEEYIIGNTYYDLQSNIALANRVHIFDDGTIGAVWTMGLEGTSFNDRGTGYNFFDGSSWGPIPGARIETLRTGWPSYAPWGSDGEIVVSHDFAAHVLYLMSRTNKGTGAWTQTAYTYSQGPTALSWPRLITSGENHETIHMLANSFDTYEGMVSAAVYSRSIDGGVSWEEENVLLDGMGPDYYNEIAADEYVFAKPVGNTIAFLIVSAWHDLFMMKSDDNGNTWEKTVIWEHPYPFYDWEVTITDTFFCVDNSANIALDNSGKAHVVFGINRVIHSETGTSYNLYPWVDGIGYWNEDMPPFSNDLNALSPPQYGYATTELEENYNYIGWTQDVDGDGEVTFITTPTGFPMIYRELGLSTMPDITISDDGTIFVIYSSTTETYDNFEYNFKHIWGRAYQNGTWGPFVDLTSNIVHIFDECIYPVLGGVYGDNFHFIYNIDAGPGTALDGDHDYIENKIVYAMVPLEELLTGISEEIPGLQESQVTQNYPNPFSGISHIRVNLKSSSNLKLEVRNMLGQLVQVEDKGRVKPGTHFFEVDGEKLSKGIYFYTVLSGTQSVTKKMILE